MNMNILSVSHKVVNVLETSSFGGLEKAPEEGLYEYGPTDDTTLNSDIHQYLVDTTPRYFGDNWGEDHPEGRICKEWSGIMGKRQTMQ